MVETIVKFVFEKVTNRAVKEVLCIYGVDKQVEKIERELVMITAFLKDADMKSIQDETQKQWVKEVRDVAYSIEDVVDTFLCVVPDKKPGTREAIKRWFQKTKKLPIIRDLTKEIDQILGRLHEISEKKVRYGIRNLGEGDAGVKRLAIKPLVLPEIEDEVVGLDTDIDNIITQLLDKEILRRRVVSITGQGGLGKTTLAKKVYNSTEVKSTFRDIRLWVTISEEFELVVVLRKILKKLGRIDENEQGKDPEYFLTELHQSLKGKKYILVLDDVWTPDLWMAIKSALPDNNNGSRILMTTRNSKVATEADPYGPYKLNFLTPKWSLELFRKNAFPNQEIRTKCSDHKLFELEMQFVNKCGGLPLALEILGSLLASKPYTYQAWNQVMQRVHWYADDQKRCIEIISTSYDDLPLALKSCFMYFAMFSEDFDINAQSLLWMWIAERFIPHEENRTLEDTAQSFLEDLVQRSMVQVTERSLHDDSIERCQIHDLLRDVAIQKAKEEDFLVVCSNDEKLQSCGQSRRIAVHNFDNSELMEHVSPNLRTLFCYDIKYPNCSGHKLLKVLSSMAPQFKQIPDRGDIKWIEGLSQLRYLRLRSDAIEWNQSSFDKLVGTMKFLQTLDLSACYIRIDLPDCIWHIKTLRHVIVLPFTNTSGPPPGTNLPNLQTLKWVKNHESWDCNNLPNLPNLHALSITIHEGFPWGSVAAFLHTLKKLAILHIKGRDIPREVVEMKDFAFYEHLTWLNYSGRLSCHDLDVTMFPTYLTKLILSDSGLQQDPMTVLENLQELKSLSLSNAYAGHTMRCSTRGFPCLQKLIFTDSQKLVTWEIEEGAMRMLKELSIIGCPKLLVPNGMQHLITLKKLFWKLQDHGELGPFKEKEIRNICKHVPSITIRWD